MFERDCDVCNVYDATMCSVEDLNPLLTFIYTDCCGEDGLLESCRRLGVSLAPETASCNALLSNRDTSVEVHDSIVSNRDTSAKVNDFIVSDCNVSEQVYDFRIGGHDTSVDIRDLPVSAGNTSVKSLSSPARADDGLIEVRSSPTTSCDVDFHDYDSFKSKVKSNSRDADDLACNLLETSPIAGSVITNGPEEHETKCHQVMSDDDLFTSFTDDHGSREQSSITINGMCNHAEITERLDEKDTNRSEKSEGSEIDRLEEPKVISFTPTSTSRGSSRISFSQPLKKRSVDVDAVPLSQPIVCAEEWGASDETILTAVCDQSKLKTPKDLCKRSGLVPITPMPNFSDMDTPEIVEKVRSGVCAAINVAMTLFLAGDEDWS